MKISFPGGLAIAAEIDGFNVLTDQPEQNGGEGTAPSPFDLFLASLGTCSGFFALRFCQQRNLSTEGLGLTLDFERDPQTRKLMRVKMNIQLPDGFPDKYRKAIIRATEECAVKKVIADPPEFEVTAGS
ncbi:MAG: osmotically inducible protein OsmC [Desulfuromonas sp.]|nr:MAG: osmotically inducible protein OsmC [Desulfuromonas sp.]